MNRRIQGLHSVSQGFEQEYANLINLYVSLGFEIEDLTKGSYVVMDNLSDNELVTRGMLLDSEVCRDLKRRGIESYTFSDLKSHIYLYGLDHDVTSTDELAHEYELTNKLAQQYDTTEKLIENEKKHISKLSVELKGIIGEEIMSKYHEKMTATADGKILLDQENKTIEEYEINRKKAIMKAEELYVNEGLIDRNSYRQLITMINTVFNDYINGSKKIPVDEFRKIMQETEQYGQDVTPRAV